MSRFAILGLAATLGLAAAPVWAEEVTVFAAASMKTALDQVAADFTAQTGNEVVISYAGSGALAKQVIAGAPADIFISAAEDWMDAVEAEGSLVADTRRTLVGNTLVLVAHGKDAPAVTIDQSLDVAALLQGGKLAMGLVESVPAGQYGKSALEALGLWVAAEPSVAQVDNVRAALTLVEAGEAPFGIVYASDAVAASDNITVVGTFPAESHAPITYPVALLTGAKDDADRAFFEVLFTEPARAIFAEQGFNQVK